MSYTLSTLLPNDGDDGIQRQYYACEVCEKIPIKWRPINIYKVFYLGFKFREGKKSLKKC